MKQTPLDIPLGESRRRSVDLLGDRWTLWILLAIHERSGARFSDLCDEPGLSRRVLADRLRTLVASQLVTTEAYSTRPPRHRYLLTDRGGQVRALLLQAIHVAAGGRLERTAVQQHGADPEGGADHHPADRLLMRDPRAARRIYEETIAPIARYDDRYRTALVDTLSTWLASDASVSVAAARLFTHRHTVRYRLGRIRELTGLDPDATEDRERLALGLRARRLAALEADSDVANPVHTDNDERGSSG